MCGLHVTVSDGQVQGIRANPDDVWSRGHICPKGVSLGRLHADPDRLRRPMVRRPDGTHVAVSWDDALAETERVLRPVLDTDGAGALSVYVGNPVAHNSHLATYIGALIGFAEAAGMKGYYSPGTVDQWPLNVVSTLLFGGMWNGPIPDLYHTDHLMILGANPAASQGSMLVGARHHGSAVRWGAARPCGGCRPASHADRAACEGVGADPTRHRRAAAVRDSARPGRERLGPAPSSICAEKSLGSTRSSRWPSLSPPEKVAVTTGINARTIRRLAHDPAHAEHLVLYSRIGACTQNSAPWPPGWYS